MNVYRLDPIDPGDPGWRYSEEKDTVWACAPNSNEARELVAAKTGAAARNGEAPRSPWRVEAASSCVLDPSMSLMDAATVVRQDGSLVGL